MSAPTGHLPILSLTTYLRRRSNIVLQYKGYTGTVEFDDEARLFHGEVIDFRDIVTFQGTGVEELS